MTECILFSHGQLAYEILRTAELIVGKKNNIYLLSNENKSLKDLKITLKNLLSGLKSENILIMVDTLGGSCWMSSSIVVKEIKGKNIKLISGFNLSMVISFMTKSEKYDFDELVGIIKSDGIKSIKEI